MDGQNEQKPKRFFLGRTIFLAVLFIIILNFIFLAPSLNEIKDRVYEHQIEITERIEADLKYRLILRAENMLNELSIFPFVKEAFIGTSQSITQKDALNFLSNKKDVLEFSVVDIDGNELVAEADGNVKERNDLKNVSGEIFFKEAVRLGSYISVVHNKVNTSHYVVASKVVSFDDVGKKGVIYIKLNLGEDLKNYADHLKNTENEFVYIVDSFGSVIDHYDGSKIGKSIYDLNYIKRDFTGDLYVNNGTYSSKEGKNSDVEYEFQETYKNNAGEKMQATGRFVGSLGVAVVIEEFYSDAWKAWRQVLMLSTIGIAMFALLSIFLVKNTISLTYISNELLKRKKHTEVIVSNLINGIIQYDSDFRVLLINPMAESMLGVKREDIIGKQINTNLLNVDPKYESLVKVLYPALSDDVRRIPSENGKPKVFEIKITKPLEMELQVTTISIHDRSGIVNGYVKVLRDISREKAISKTKSEFISVAAHQLRTPLSAIKWIFKMLMDGDVGALSKEQKEFLQKGYDSNERIIQLVGDMLNVARIEEGRFGYEFYYVDVIELIKKNIKTMGLKAEEKNIKLEFEGPKDEIKPIKIDPARIELVIQNLLDNALKYTQKNGNISVKIEKADNSFVKISVKDSGVGIPKDQRERLFTKFFRGSNVIKMQTEGTGLGLFITRNIVKRHGGDIRVESESGSGTTFSFTLPLDESLIPSKESDMSDAISL